MKFRFLSKYFPPPEFLKPPHLGISFSDINIKAIMFDRGRAKPYLKSFIVPIEKGSIVGGSIVNMEDIVKKLSIVKENFNLPFAFFAIPDELTYLFSISIPVSSKGDAAESVAFTIEENVPLSLNEATFDFKPTEVTLSGSEHHASMAVAACVKSEVEKFVKAFRESGLEPIGCVHESQAIAEAVIPSNFSGTSCIIHARENRVGIYLAKGNTTHFSTIRSILDGDYSKQFLDEYEKFLEYCSKYNAEGGQSIRSVFVCGDFRYAKKVVETIINGSSFKDDTKLSNVWVNVLSIEKDLPSISYEESLSLAGPIGAVLSSIM